MSRWRARISNLLLVIDRSITSIDFTGSRLKPCRDDGLPSHFSLQTSPMPKTSNRKTIISWMMYDFANSSFANNVTTFIYAAFFTKVIAENEIVGTALWSRGVGIIMLIVALLSPPLGALADQGGYRKRFLMFCNTPRGHLHRTALFPATRASNLCNSHIHYCLYLL